MPFGLSEEAVDKIQTILARYEQVKQAILYGSRAKGTFKPGSDIDLTLKGEDLDLHVLNSISHDLDELLLPYTIDVS
ncbi:MAG: nucleotidyltransferase domain-containing protein, partial [Desulfohalobiaceae bacterium]|nr:nucleotidyltransferase domain-containing protein [Desulfohalobiaceae bacterium]